MRSRLLLPLALVYLLLLLSCLLLSPLSIHKTLDTSNNSILRDKSLTERAPSIPEGEPVLSSLASCENITGPASLPDQLRWDVLSVALAILQELSVPYLLESGSLLHLVRECGLGNFDMDVSVDSRWWREEGNQARLQQAMEAKGLWRVSVFGDINKFGYEERYMVARLQLGIFASETNKTGGEIWTAVWLKGFVYPCVMKIESYVWYSWWGQQVRLPFPLAPALISMYGPKYTKKAPPHSYFLYKCKCGVPVPGHPSPNKTQITGACRKKVFPK